MPGRQSLKNRRDRARARRREVLPRGERFLSLSSDASFVRSESEWIELIKMASTLPPGFDFRTELGDCEDARAANEVLAICRQGLELSAYREGKNGFA